MEYMSNFDFYEVRFGSILSDSDRKVLIDLYQPLVGAGAIALFFKLWSDCENDKETGFYSIDKLLTNMKITGQDLISQRKHLEALGLLKTYEKKIDAGKSTYMFCLYAPKQPSEFFDDPFFSSLLTKYIGKKDVQRLVLLYKTKIDTNGYKDITSTFGEVFSNDMTSLKFNDSIDASQIKGRKNIDVYTNFDQAKFVGLLVENLHLEKDFLSKKELENIAKISAIYGIDENTAVNYLEYYCNFKGTVGKRIDFDKLTKTYKNLNNYLSVLPKKENVSTTIVSSEEKELDTNGKYADFIKLMEETPSARLLSMLQNNTVPSDADLGIIEMLATNYKFSNGVINVLIRYTLDMKDNTLPRKYIEKVAASLVREGVTTVVEALNYLNKVNKKSKEKKESTTYKPNKDKKFFDDENDKIKFNPELEDEDVDE